MLSHTFARSIAKIGNGFFFETKTLKKMDNLLRFQALLEEQEEGATTNNGKPVLRYDANDELMELARALVLRHINFTEVSYLNSDWDNLMAYYKAQEALDKLPDESRKPA